MGDLLDVFHWSFFAAAFIIAVVTGFLRRIFKILPQNKWVVFFTPLHLFGLALGAFLGTLPGIPAPEVVGGPETGIGHMIYFATAGIVSTWIYSLAEKLFKDILPTELKQFIEKKLGTEGDPPEEKGIDDDTRG